MADLINFENFLDYAPCIVIVHNNGNNITITFIDNVDLERQFHEQRLNTENRLYIDVDGDVIHVNTKEVFYTACLRKRSESKSEDTSNSENE